MLLNAYSLLDVKAGLFSPPFFLVHDSLAVRAVVELVSDRSTTPGKYPADFVLYCVGAFDDNSGAFAALGAPRNLGVCAALAASAGAVEGGQ